MFNIQTKAHERHDKQKLFLKGEAKRRRNRNRKNRKRKE